MPDFIEPGLLVPIVIIVILVIVIFSAGYRKAPPDKAFIISGLRRKAKVVIGKATVKLPFFERCDVLELALMSVDVKTAQAVPTADYINISVDAVVNVKISPDPDIIQKAQQNFLNRNVQYITGVAREVLEGNMREIVGQMRLEEMVSNRQAFADKVKQNADPDLRAMGLEIVSFNVQNFVDDNGIINDMGIDNTMQIKKKAAISKAEAERDVSCAKAAAAMAANEKEIEAQTAIAKRNNELELAKSQLKAEADKAAADAQAAGMIQTNLRAREVKESEADAEIAKQKKMVDLAAQEAEVQQRKLDAEVRKQADAELYRRQKEAEAQKYEAERAAEAAKFAKQQEAEGIALVGRAEAEAIRQKGLAEAEAMKQKAEAYKQYNDAAVAEMMIKVLPDIAKSVAQPLSAIDKVSIIGGDAGGVSGISGNVPVLMAQTIEAMKEATGIDMKEIVRANSIQAKTDRNINVTGLDSLKPENPENKETQTTEVTAE